MASNQQIIFIIILLSILGIGLLFASSSETGGYSKPSNNNKKDPVLAADLSSLLTPTAPSSSSSSSSPRSSSPPSQNPNQQQEPPSLELLLKRGVVSTKIHEQFIEPHKSGLAVVVVGTGHMREYRRCAPRLISSVLRPNSAVLTMTTYPSYSTLGLPLVPFGGPAAVQHARDLRSRNTTALKGQRRKTKKEMKELLELVPSTIKKSVTHEQLREVYGEHLAMSVMLESEGLLGLAQDSAPGVSFNHYITVLAQWAAIEIAYEKTFAFLKSDAASSWAEAFRGDNIVFLRIRPDIFVVGTTLLFRVKADRQQQEEHKKHELGLDKRPISDPTVAEPRKIELYLECGAEPSSYARSESPAKRYSFRVGLDRDTSGSTVWRTPPFPEFTWPLDPLSDFSAITVGGPEVSAATSAGHRMWSWVLRRPYPENFSYVSPENVTTQFLRATGLKTAAVPFGWHFLLRAAGYPKVHRRGMRVAKKLKYNGTRVFRTDDEKSVRCP